MHEKIQLVQAKCYLPLIVMRIWGIYGLVSLSPKRWNLGIRISKLDKNYNNNKCT